MTWLVTFRHDMYAYNMTNVLWLFMCCDHFFKFDYDMHARIYIPIHITSAYGYILYRKSVAFVNSSFDENIVWSSLYTNSAATWTKDTADRGERRVCLVRVGLDFEKENGFRIIRISTLFIHSLYYLDPNPDYLSVLK